MVEAYKTTILLIDNHAVVRAALRALLETEKDMKVVGALADGKTAVFQARTLQPTLIIFDAATAQDLVTIRTLKADNPNTQILILTEQQNKEHICAALQAGVAGYLLKDNNIGDLLQAIRDINNGKQVLHPVAHNSLRPTPQGPIED